MDLNQRCPRPLLAALALDLTVGLLALKSSIAVGFDVQSAVTLAAPRCIRDANFGIQVVGHFMRVHPLLQRRPGTLPVLDYG